jgi:tetratricopeptide (TPR) repeat protein
MKIIRWLLSHLFLILLVVVVIYGYMFWGNLAGEDTPAGKALAYLSSEFVEVEEFINAVKAKQAKLNADQQHPAGNKLENEGSGSSKPIVADTGISQQPVSISYSHNQMLVEQNSAGDMAGDIEAQAEVVLPAAAVAPESQPERTTDPVSTASDKFISPIVERQLSNVDSNGKVINQSVQGDTIRESWITARKSFYQRQYELSEQSYQDVINNTTDNFDAYGELGNVYFNQGKKEAAAMAYFEAASILVRKGQIRRAKSLMGLLRHLDKNKANDLQKLIDSAVS